MVGVYALMVAVAVSAMATPAPLASATPEPDRGVDLRDNNIRSMRTRCPQCTPLDAEWQARLRGLRYVSDDGGTIALTTNVDAAMRTAFVSFPTVDRARGIVRIFFYPGLPEPPEPNEPFAPVNSMDVRVADFGIPPNAMNVTLPDSSIGLTYAQVLSRIKRAAIGGRYVGTVGRSGTGSIISYRADVDLSIGPPGGCQTGQCSIISQNTYYRYYYFANGVVVAEYHNSNDQQWR